MAVKDPPAIMFLYQKVHVLTHLIDSQNSDESGDVFYTFSGILLDVDEKYITLGSSQDGEMMPQAAIRHDDIKLIQIASEEDENTLNPNNTSLN